MISPKIIKNSIFGILVALTAVTTSCKKNPSQPTQEPVNVIPTRAELTKDSIYLYAQQTYFWNVGMPTYEAFNPRKFATNEDVVAGIRGLASNGGKDKYSFIDDGTVATEIGGTAGDFGFSVFYAGDSDLRIKYVYATSPAAVKDLKRGYQITKINGFTDINTSDASIKKVVDAVFGSAASISLTVKKPDGTSQDVVVAKASYSINPILFTKTYSVGAKKIGYIVFNSFTSNSTPQLDAAFSTFAAEGVKELVVDLRYNGGGSVATSQALTNLIAPSSQTGNVMFTSFFNQTMQDGKATILQNIKFRGNDNKIHSYFEFSFKPTEVAGNREVFEKRGTLEGITRVYFLVLGGTASASELVINNLKPVVSVKLIGRQTYGKPVGFFGISIDKSDLYVPQFQTRNQVDQGDYFGGFTPDKIVNDDVTKEFGDPSEAMLAQALYYSANGNFTSFARDNSISSTTPFSTTKMADLTEKLDHSFKGMVEFQQPKLKK